MVRRDTFVFTGAFLLCVDIAIISIMWGGLARMSTSQLILHVVIFLVTTAFLLLSFDIFWRTPSDVSYPLLHHLTIYFMMRFVKPLMEVKFRKFILHTKECKKVQESYLLEQLRINCDTVYGRKYRFSEIMSREQYVELVPLTKQADIAPYCQRIADGERNVLTKEDPVMMALTTGTTGANCPIPVVTSALNRDTAAIVSAVEHVTSKMFPRLKEVRKIVYFLFASTDRKTRGGLPCGPLSSLQLKGKEAMFSKISTTPKMCFSLASQHDRTYLVFLFALAEKSVSRFVTGFTIALYDGMSLVETKWRQMVQEIRSGHLSPGFESDADTLLQIENCLKPDPARADELEAEFQKGFDGIMKRLWPHMQYISAMNSGSMALYGELLERKYSKGIRIYSPTYGGTEAYGGVNMSVLSDTAEYALLPNASFYEFIAESDIDEDQPRTFFADQVQVGKNYEIVQTHMNGLCRYRVGDVVGVTGFFNNTPTVTFLYRNGQLLNLINEKTTEVSVLDTVNMTVAGWKGCTLHDYTCAVNAMLESVTGDLSRPGPYYVFFIELRFKDGLERKISDTEKAEMDSNLRTISQGYDICRGINKIKPIVVHLVEQGSFAELKEFILQTTTASYAQFKMPRVLKRESLVEFMLTKVKG